MQGTIFAFDLITIPFARIPSLSILKGIISLFYTKSSNGKIYLYTNNIRN